VGYGAKTAYGQDTVKKVLSGPRLEVNHVWPLARQMRRRKRYGKTTAEDWWEMVPLRHSDSGCHHHLSLLVTLCKPCHRRTTNQQFGFKVPTPQMALEVA
jgi:5-methylcytosine-specific restriction endonuclease McrA